ncbi:MAG: hypothetical protein AAB353_13315 [Candidatus Hydrogenedentota bacterium]
MTNDSPREARETFGVAESLLLLLALSVYVVIMVRTAWVCDDAYITMRTVDNFVNGHGLRWNIGERVQVYTHPLWMLCVSPIYALTGNAYFTLLGLSGVCSVGTAVILGYGIAHRPLTGALGITMLALSCAFVDYSSSGLENPLTHLLLALGLWIYLRAMRGPGDNRSLFWLSFVAALAAVNRMDIVLLYLPLLVTLWWRLPKGKATVAGAAGFIPLGLWLSFSTLYYGFPWPNTAFAKLSTGIAKIELFPQGLLYCLHSIVFDPITPVIIVCAGLQPLLRRQYLYLPVSAGIALYLAYTVRIGGDFMGGRFFAAPYLCAAAYVAAQRMTAGWAVAILLLMGVLGAIGPHPTFQSGASYGGSGDEARRRAVKPSGIADERAYYYHRTGLLLYARDKEWPFVTYSRKNPPLRPSGIAVERNIGFMGYYGARARIHILDPLGLCDPLIARLPAKKPWRIGHFERALPQGYEMTIATGTNHIVDPDLALYYDRLSLVISGPILDSARLRHVFHFNIGSYNELIENYVARAASTQR